MQVTVCIYSKTTLYLNPGVILAIIIAGPNWIFACLLYQNYNNSFTGLILKVAMQEAELMENFRKSI